MAQANLSAIHRKEDDKPYSNEIAGPVLEKDDLIINYDNVLISISLRIGRVRIGRNSHPP